MTAAQKTAKANFKKAIEYRKKTGVSLKEAFAHVYGKKVGAAPKKKAAKKAAPKKAAKKVVKKAAPKKVAKKTAPKKAAKKKHTKYGKVKAHTRRVAGVKKADSIHKDTKSHNVNIRVVSGLPSYKNAVRVYFTNPKYNYSTSVGPNVTEEEAKKYFLGKFFNVGVYPKEILQKPTRIKFFRYIDK
jgi:hypothetical protein